MSRLLKACESTASVDRFDLSSAGISVLGEVLHHVGASYVDEGGECYSVPPEMTEHEAAEAAAKIMGMSLADVDRVHPRCAGLVAHEDLLHIAYNFAHFLKESGGYTAE